MNNEGIIMLSVLIPSIPSRAKMFAQLFSKLYDQKKYLTETHPMLGDVQLFVDVGDAFLNGGSSIGKKRESLVNNATGKYLCFLDDDESIAPNYLETLVRLCNEDKDVCTFRNLTKLDTFWTVVDMSLSHTENEQVTPDVIVKRKPWHVCPVRSEFAKRYEFEDSNYGEDWQWFERVLSHCHNEAKTNAIIHQYNHSKINSEADKITNHEQQGKGI